MTNLCKRGSERNLEACGTIVGLCGGRQRPICPGSGLVLFAFRASPFVSQLDLSVGSSRGHDLVLLLLVFTVHLSLGDARGLGSGIIFGSIPCSALT